MNFPYMPTSCMALEYGGGGDGIGPVLVMLATDGTGDATTDCRSCGWRGRDGAGDGDATTLVPPFSTIPVRSTCGER